MISLTVYTIYGGIIDKENVEVTSSIDNFFKDVKKELNNREIDKIIRDNIKYKIDDISIDNNTATAEVEITGLDLAQSFYELDMYHAFYREFTLNSDVLFVEPIIDTYDIYNYILNKNKKNTQTSNLTLQLNKSDDKWNVENKNDVFLAIEKSSVDLKSTADKSYENLEKAKEAAREKYLQENNTELSFEQYWANYLLDFINNKEYVTQFPFDEQKF